ncbi:MAG: hypothetical protein QOI95_4400 [Acidimicrobiaceae bacterium]|jgi:uncharacterized protein (TIGR03085 family)
MLRDSQDSRSGLTKLRALERQALVDDLHAAGPAAPTLCSGWTAIDVAAHLVGSEQGWGLPMVTAYRLRRALPGSVVRRGMARLQTLGDRQIERVKRRGWDALLARLASGPPRPYQLRSVAPIRYIEEWIHHEDVRRANGLGPRPSSAAEDDALWHAGLELTALRELLPGREHVELVLPDGRSHRIGPTSTIRVQGKPGELLLFLAGRIGAAVVEVTGDPDEIHALHRQLTV